MIKNQGLGLLAEVAADEDYYPVRRRGQKRRLNPNRAAIEWLENDTLDLTEERGRFLMSDTGGRYALDDTRDDLIAVTRTYGSTLGTHHSRPMFECFKITWNKGVVRYPRPCPECDNLAYSFQGCERHAFTSELDQISAPTLRTAQEQSIQLEGLVALYASEGGPVALTWEMDAS